MVRDDHQPDTGASSGTGTGASAGTSSETRIVCLPHGSAMSGEALDQIAGQADAIDNTKPAGDAGQAPPAAPPMESANVGAIAFLLSAFRELSCRILSVESPRTTLNHQNVVACAQALAPVADKYGIDLGAIFNGPEAMALMVAGPLLWEAANQLNLELKARRAKPTTEPAAADKDDVTMQPPNAG